MHIYIRTFDGEKQIIPCNWAGDVKGHAAIQIGDFSSYLKLLGFYIKVLKN